jgi:Uma2 family endonuclease
VVERSALGGLAVTADAVRLAVEITSPSTALMDRGLKAELYAELSVPTYWVLAPSGDPVPYERAPSFASDGDPWMHRALETFRASLPG